MHTFDIQIVHELVAAQRAAEISGETQYIVPSGGDFKVVDEEPEDGIYISVSYKGKCAFECADCKSLEFVANLEMENEELIEVAT